jgi:hypothetical protein
MRTIVRPHVGESETLHARAGELRLRMDDGNLLLEGHPAQGIVDALLNGLGLVEVDGEGLSLRQR